MAYFAGGYEGQGKASVPLGFVNVNVNVKVKVNVDWLEGEKVERSEGGLVRRWESRKAGKSKTRDSGEWFIETEFSFGLGVDGNGVNE